MKIEKKTRCFKFTGLITLFISVVAHAQSLQLPEGWTNGYVYANDIRIHYYKTKTAPGKPTMVMAHGVTDNGLCWTTLALKLQDSYNIYMVDARGHGLTDPFTVNDHEETMVYDVVEFVKALQLEKPVLMGHSMGAGTMIRVGAEYPDLGSALILLDPYIPNNPSQGSMGDTSKRWSFPSETLKESVSPDRLSISMVGGPEILVRQNNFRFEDLLATGRRQFPKWHQLDIQYWALSKKQYHGPFMPEGISAMRGLMKSENALSKFQVPTLILKADAPDETRKRNDKAALVLQKGKLVHIDDSGHNLHHDQLDATEREIRAFLLTYK